MVRVEMEILVIKVRVGSLNIGVCDGDGEK